MALRVNAAVNVTISQDNVANPQEISFASGAKTFTDTVNFTESTSQSVVVAAGATDVHVSLGAITTTGLMYLMAKGPGISVKLVPQGGLLSSTPAYGLAINTPAVIPFPIIAVYVSNANAASQSLVLGAAGN